MPRGDSNFALWIMKQLAAEGRWHMVEPFYNIGGQALDIRTVNQRLEDGNYANAADFQSELLSIPTKFLTKGLSRASEKASDLLQELPTLFKRRQLQDTLLRKRSQQQQQPPQQPPQHPQQQQPEQEPTDSSSSQAANHDQPVSAVVDNQAASSAAVISPQSPPAAAESAVPSPNHRRSLSIRPADPSATSQIQTQAREAQTRGTGTTEQETKGGDSVPDQSVVEQPTKHSAKRAASPQDLPATKRPRQDVSSSKSVGAQTGTQSLAYTPALHNAIEAAMVREARVIAEMQKSTNLEGDRKKSLQRASLTKRQKVRETIEGELKRDHVRAVAASMHEEIRKASMGILDRLIAEEAEHKQQEIFDKQQKEIDQLKWMVNDQQHTIDEQQKLIASLQQNEQADETMEGETIEEARAGKKKQH
ncbi:hypothetical protein KCU89_g4631, partial [Aureobasidium melanogenum]